MYVYVYVFVLCLCICNMYLNCVYAYVICICIMYMYMNTYMDSYHDLYHTYVICIIYNIYYELYIHIYLYIHREIQDPILIVVSDSTFTTPFVTNPLLLIWRWAVRVSTQPESTQHTSSAPSSPLSLTHSDWIHFSAHGHPPMPAPGSQSKGATQGHCSCPGPLPYLWAISCRRK